MASLLSYQILEFIVSQYETLFDAYMEARPLIPEGQLYECAFDDLERDAVAELERVYNTLGWHDAWEAVR
jgi:hypothetical protein